MKASSFITRFILLLALSTVISTNQGEQQNEKSSLITINDETPTHTQEDPEQEVHTPTPDNNLSSGLKCSNNSIILTRQFLIHQLDTINALTNIWFNDVDTDEIMEQQKKSLARLIMTSNGNLNSKVLNSDGQPPIEVETSYFRPASAFKKDLDGPVMITPEDTQPISIKLIGRYRDKCILNHESTHYNYQFAVSIGPFIHSLDIIQHLPRELKLSQPIDWRYFQVRLLIQRMVYEVTIRQTLDHSLLAGCPIELTDMNYINLKQTRPFKWMLVKGYGINKDSRFNLTRIFDDYTLPAVSKRLKSVLRFQMNGKSLPLSP